MASKGNIEAKKQNVKAIPLQAWTDYEVVKWFQEDATIAFILRNGFTLHVSGDSSTHHQEYNAVYGLAGRQVYLCCNFVNILVVLSLSVVLSCR